MRHGSGSKQNLIAPFRIRGLQTASQNRQNLNIVRGTIRELHYSIDCRNADADVTIIKCFLKKVDSFGTGIGKLLDKPGDVETRNPCRVVQARSQDWNHLFPSLLDAPVRYGGLEAERAVVILKFFSQQ